MNSTARSDSRWEHPTPKYDQTQIEISTVKTKTSASGGHVATPSAPACKDIVWWEVAGECRIVSTSMCEMWDESFVLDLELGPEFTQSFILRRLLFTKHLTLLYQFSSPLTQPAPTVSLQSSAWFSKLSDLSNQCPSWQKNSETRTIEIISFHQHFLFPLPKPQSIWNKRVFGSELQFHES